jgi:hypothetical protein
VYRGNATIAADGRATVSLPEYFRRHQSGANLPVDPDRRARGALHCSGDRRQSLCHRWRPSRNESLVDGDRNSE